MYVYVNVYVKTRAKNDKHQQGRFVCLFGAAHDEPTPGKRQPKHNSRRCNMLEILAENVTTRNSNKALLRVITQALVSDPPEKRLSRIVFRETDTFHKSLRLWCARRGLDVSEFIRRAVREAVARQDPHTANGGAQSGGDDGRAVADPQPEGTQPARAPLHNLDEFGRDSLG